MSPHICTLIRFLAEEGFEPTVATVLGGSPPALPLPPSVDIVELAPRRPERKPLLLLEAASKLRKLIRQRKFRAIYAIDSWTLPLIWLANRGSFRFRGTAFVYHTFDWLEPGLHARPHFWFESAACRSASLVVNVDRSRARLQQTLYRLQALPLAIPNFPSRRMSVPPRDAELRRRLLGPGGSPQDVLIAYSSSASPDRLHLELVQAVALLPAHYRLMTFQGGPPYFDRCVELAKRLNVSDRVQFLQPMPFTRLLEHLVCCDVGAAFHPWRASSGYFMANPDRLASYLACGLPAVGTNVPNVESLVYKYGLGCCCDPYQPRDIATAIQDMVEGKPGLEARHEHVRAVFESDLYFEKRAQDLADRLRQLAPT
jgi:glycosyltransferase involved in cell wall biosynthesis